MRDARDDGWVVGYELVRVAHMYKRSCFKENI